MNLASKLTCVSMTFSLFMRGLIKLSLSSSSNVFTGPGNTVRKMRAVTFCVVLSKRSCSTSYQLDLPCFMSARCHRFYVLDRFIPFGVMGSVLEIFSAWNKAIGRVHPWMCRQLITGPDMRNQWFRVLRQCSEGVRTHISTTRIPSLFCPHGGLNLNPLSPTDWAAVNYSMCFQFSFVPVQCSVHLDLQHPCSQYFTVEFSLFCSDVLWCDYHFAKCQSILQTWKQKLSSSMNNHYCNLVNCMKSLFL